MTANYRIVSEIYEEGRDYPAVTHFFRGVTLKEAHGHLQAHLAADRFFQACVVKGRFSSFPCREARISEVWTGERWVRA